MSKHGLQGVTLFLKKINKTIISIRWAGKLRCLGRPCVISLSKGRKTNLFVVAFSDKQTSEKSGHEGNEMR